MKYLKKNLRFKYKLPKSQSFKKLSTLKFKHGFLIPKM